ncbi:uncharacterized protein LOC116111504 [Pistacia vera]|uniref:uncharacterized protein LOC116111504 n=1 Tax=Pistacia vera TaxID=55513 RepID=UPI001263DE56|nr:uncharacterized protein LOC116111504 [Pistacia vera]
MKKMFLERYFPASKAATIRKEICGIGQYNGETLYEYWERFKKLCASCPHHQISDQLLIQYLYEGLLPMERNMIDAASRGALVDKTPKAAKQLISNMAANSQQFSTRNDAPSKRVNEVKACGICSTMGHQTDMCLTLQEERTEQVNAVGSFPGPPKQHDLYSNTYNPVKSFALNTKQFQQDTRSSIQSLENQMGQMATAISRLEAQVGGKLPSQTVVNPKENVNTVTLRSGKKVGEPKLNIPSVAQEAEIEDEIEKEEGTTESKVIPNSSIQLQSNTLPFPSRFVKSKKEEKDKEILEMFRKVEVNIPLLDAIKQVPRYAKFLKELCTNKRKLNGDEKIIMGENVSAVFQRKLTPKCKDPGPVKDTSVIIQLADRTNAYPEGVVEDVLVQVNKLVFPADFYILDMDDSSSPYPVPILLGIPFLNIARTKIDVYDGTLTMEFDGESIFAIDVVDLVDSIVQEIFELNNADELEAPTLELKPLPGHLKHVYLGENEKADIKGISPSICMHRILLEEGAKPTREEQRRLNTPMMDVVKKEVLKLLDAEVIYPIFDSWRVCIDYRKLNSTTRKYHFPLPFIDQMLERLLQKDVDFQFDEKCKEAFDKLKTLLTTTPEFDLQIKDKKGAENVIADYLSRLVRDSDELPL